MLELLPHDPFRRPADPVAVEGERLREVVYARVMRVTLGFMGIDDIRRFTGAYCRPMLAARSLPGMLGALLLLASASLHADEPLSPKDYYFLSLEAKAALDREDFAKSSALYKQLADRFPLDSSNWAWYSTSEHWLGHREEANRIARKALEMGTPWNSTIPYELARNYALLGRKDEAFEWIERALAGGYTPRTNLQSVAEFQGFVSDERFRALAGLLPARTFSRDAGWRYDIEFLVGEAKRLHASRKREAFSPQFAAAAAELSAAVPSLTDAQVRVGLRKLVTLLGDGHTGVDIQADERSLPLQLYFFSDGVYVISASRPYERWIGSRVVQIGPRSVDELVSGLAAYIPRDNAMGVKWRGPRALIQLDILQALGATNSPESVTLELQQGSSKPRKVTMKAGPPANESERLPALQIASPPKPPLYLRDTDTPYWFTRLEGGQPALYFQFNLIRDMEDKTMAAFATELHAALADGAIQNLIVDLRHNAGGNTGLYPPLIRTMAAFQAARPGARIFCIIGRNTFSAAQNFTVDMERLLNVVFVGEPTGSSPNFTGEGPYWFELPYSHTRASISHWTHQLSSWSDRRSWIAPQVPVELSSKDYFANRDPALEAILDIIATDKGSLRQ
jgi:hypothetical protein